METQQVNRGRAGSYIVFFIIAIVAVGLALYFGAPKHEEVAINSKDATMFIENKLVDIDRKLKDGEDEKDLATRLSWHKSNTALYNQLKDSKDQAINGQREELKQKMVKIQEREFPELRDAYVSSKKEAFEQEHIQIAVSGEHKEVLTVSGDMFEPEKTQKAFTKNIEEIASDLRFREIVYKAADNSKDFGKYELESKDDTEI